MPRKNNDNNPLQIRLRAISLPRVKPQTYYRRLMQVITEGRPLPESWNVELHWRNPNVKHGLTKRWRKDDFESAVSDSRDGFNMLLHDALARMIQRYKKRKR